MFKTIKSKVANFDQQNDLTIPKLTRYEEAQEAGQNYEQSGKVFAQVVSSDISSDQNATTQTGVGAERILCRAVLCNGIADGKVWIVNSFRDLE